MKLNSLPFFNSLKQIPGKRFVVFITPRSGQSFFQDAWKEETILMVV